MSRRPVHERFVLRADRGNVNHALVELTLGPSGT